LKRKVFNAVMGSIEITEDSILRSKSAPLGERDAGAIRARTICKVYDKNFLELLSAI